MGGDRLIAGVGLADEKVGLAADLDQSFGPFGVAGKSDHLVLHFEAKSEAGPGAIVMLHVEWRNADVTDLIALADIQFPQRQSEIQLHRLAAGKSAFHDFGQAGLETRRTNDRKRLRALADVIGLKQEERQTENVVGVKMRDENRLDGIAIDAKLVHCDKGRRAAIDQCVGIFADEMKAGIETTPGAEGIAAAYELEVHEKISAEFREDLAAGPEGIGPSMRRRSL